MNKETPMLFSTPMVQAILEGRKTQTRRAVKGMALQWLQPGYFIPEYVANIENDLCPYGYKGDVLWVRETWKPKYVKGGLDGFQANYPNVYPWIYAADGESEKGYGSWKPSIHLPKTAARIWLEVTDIRVERLHDISEEDAKAEGVEVVGVRNLDDPNDTFRFRDYRYKDKFDDKARLWYGAKRSFETLWQSINGEESWNKNPWVWVVEFKILSTTGKPSIETAL